MVGVYKIISTVPGEMKDFVSSEALCALAAGTSCSRSHLESPWHQASGLTMWFSLSVAWNILSLFSICFPFLFFFFKKITSS